MPLVLTGGFPTLKVKRMPLSLSLSPDGLQYEGSAEGRGSPASVVLEEQGSLASIAS